MFIVINLSEKLYGLSLFECFTNKMIRDGKIRFANETTIPYRTTDVFNDLREKIETILFNNHVNKWHLILICDSEDMLNKPLSNNIVSTISYIRETIIKPISNKYSFGTLYYLSLDNLVRNLNGTYKDDNLTLAVDIDSHGYLIHENINTMYNKIVFTETELEKIDRKWKALQRDDKKSLASQWKTYQDIVINDYFEKKINSIKDEDLEWYSNTLLYIESIFADLDVIPESHLPSDYFRRYFKNLLSSYRETNSIILRFEYDEESDSYNSNVARFRNTLKILQIISYIVEGKIDTLLVSNNNPMYFENHWTVSANLNDNRIQDALTLFEANLNKNRAFLFEENYNDSSVELEVFDLKEFRINDKMIKPEINRRPKIDFFEPKDQPGIIRENDTVARYNDALKERYDEGAKKANERLIRMTNILRINSNSYYSKTNNKLAKTESIRYNELNKKKMDVEFIVRDLEEKIKKFKQKDYRFGAESVKKEYDNLIKKLKKVMEKRIKKSTLVEYSMFLLLILNNVYYFLKKLDLPITTFYTYYFLCTVVPIILYVIVQIIIGIKIKDEISDIFDQIEKLSEKHADEFYKEDSDEYEYVKNFNDLIQYREYLRKIKDAIKQNGIDVRLYDYHYTELIKHIDICESILANLNLSKVDYDALMKLTDVDRLNKNKSVINNDLYCPTSYFNNKEINTSIYVNNTRCREIKNANVACLDSITFNYDREFKDEWN